MFLILFTCLLDDYTWYNARLMNESMNFISKYSLGSRFILSN